VLAAGRRPYDHPHSGVTRFLADHELAMTFDDVVKLVLPVVRVLGLRLSGFQATYAQPQTGALENRGFEEPFRVGADVCAKVGKIRHGSGSNDTSRSTRWPVIDQA
jgi:hypothetical protein